ncbi:MAG: VOC family protein [Myxococcota bacterium]
MSAFDQQVTFIDVLDLDRSHHFYSRLLRLPLALDQGRCRIYTVTSTAFLGVCQRERVQASDGIILTLVTDAVDRWYQRLERAGVPIDTAPTRNDTYRIYHCFVRDPDGWRVEIQRFEDPAWPRP